MTRRRPAILHQAAPPPVAGGARKPMKEGGYSDSGADIAFTLRGCGIDVVTPTRHPDPSRDLDWVFPDSAEGIEAALAAGAEILWLNTVLFAGHPIEQVRGDVAVVGQEPACVQLMDDKSYTNELLRSNGLPVARHELVGNGLNGGLSFPLVVKPVRGRGSQGVAVVDTREALAAYCQSLLAAGRYGEVFLAEEYLPGEEITLTIMPPGRYEAGGVSFDREAHWSLPVVVRVNHVDGIAPYCGVIEVVRNSFAIGDDASDAEHRAMAAAAERAAAIIGARAPIRIDCRRGADGAFRLFDVNMKPNMTGAGRPGRELQDSLTAIAARRFGWNYSDLLLNMLDQAWRIES